MDQLRQPAPDVGHFVFETRDRFFPFCDRLRTVGKEGSEDLDQLRSVGQIGIEYLTAVLPEDRPLWRLEQDIFAGITRLKLGASLQFSGRL